MKVSGWGERRTPCYDCERRCAGCHGTCKEYADYKAGIDEKKEIAATERRLAQIAVERMIKAQRNQRNARRRKYYREGKDGRNGVHG